MPIILFYVPGTVLNILQILANGILTAAPMLEMRKQRPTMLKPCYLQSHHWCVLNVTSYRAKSRVYP